MSDTLVIQPRDTSAVAIIRDAIAAKADPVYLRELLAVRQAWEADEARKTFSAAVAEFQRRAPIIAKADKAYDKEYARMDRIWREVRPLLTELGLSVTWQVCELRPGDIFHVEGMLRHRDGHGERLAYDIPVPDIIKGQNKAQQVGSATTYAKRYAFCGALGIVTGDDTDDDGHMAATAPVTKEQAQSIADKLDACRGLRDFNEDAFWHWLEQRVGVERGRLDLIPASHLSDVIGALDRRLRGAK